MPYRKNPLVEGEIYHICSKSIAGFEIFNKENDFDRMYEAMRYYALKNPPCKFSLFLERKKSQSSNEPTLDYSNKAIRIIAYCLMPTHIHLLLQQLEGGSISKYINLLLKSYSKYFNLKYRRKGPLWEGRFRSILVASDEQFRHLTRYIHLNPTSALLTDNPINWKYSSYKEYIKPHNNKERVCDFSDYLDIDHHSYKKFVEDQIDYQRTLEKIKHLTLE